MYCRLLVMFLLRRYSMRKSMVRAIAAVTVVVVDGVEGIVEISISIPMLPRCWIQRNGNETTGKRRMKERLEDCPSFSNRGRGFPIVEFLCGEDIQLAQGAGEVPHAR